jgi:hypothetical protein
MSKRLAVGPTPQVKIKLVEGDLRLIGWENDELLAMVDDEGALKVKELKEAFSLTCQDDLALDLPRGSQVTIQTVNGDMSARGLIGDLQVEAVHGDLAVRDVGRVTLGSIEADFSLRRAKGDVHVRSVGGDASLRELAGNVAIDTVGDDLAVRAVEGDLKVDVDGDIVAHLDPLPEHRYALASKDDIMLLLPPEANATLSITAERIRLEWPGLEAGEGSPCEVILGTGEAQIKLEAGGDVVITNRLDAVESAEEYGNFAGMMFDWGGFGRDLGERISRRAQEAAERVARKASSAGRRANRHMRRGAGGRWEWNFPSGGSVEPVSPVSEEERMTILRLLAEKKITAEEASRLLSALEGEG